MYAMYLFVKVTYVLTAFRAVVYEGSQAGDPHVANIVERNPRRLDIGGVLVRVTVLFGVLLSGSLTGPGGGTSRH